MLFSRSFFPSPRQSVEQRSFHQGCKSAFCKRLEVTIERLHFHIQSSSTPDLVSVCIRLACKMVEWIMMVQFHPEHRGVCKEDESMLEKSNVHFFIFFHIFPSPLNAIRAVKQIRDGGKTAHTKKANA
jgi:hypothetical protein